jgi:hypothetical protein
MQMHTSPHKGSGNVMETFPHRGLSVPMREPAAVLGCPWYWYATQATPHPPLRGRAEPARDPLR